MHTANLLFSKQIGDHRSAATPIAFAWQSLLRLDPLFQPGLKYELGYQFGLTNATEKSAVRWRLE